MTMTQPSGESLESERDVQLGMAMLERLGQWVHELTELPVPNPGSVLAVEDRLNPYEPGSHLVRHYDAVARDNLQAVTDVCMAALPADGNRGIPTFALYSQLRTSIEAMGWAYWLIMNNVKAKRVLRALRITYGHAEDFEGTARSLGEEWPAEARRERLRQIKDSVPQLQQVELTRPPTTSDMLRVAGSAVQADPLSALNAWKLCSGIAHGSRPLVYNLSERRQLSEPDEHGSVSLELLARVAWVASIAKLASEFITATRVRYMELATHDYGSRPVPGPD